jgi:hypothetical protein
LQGNSMMVTRKAGRAQAYRKLLVSSLLEKWDHKNHKNL